MHNAHLMCHFAQIRQAGHIHLLLCMTKKLKTKQKTKTINTVYNKITNFTRNL